MGGNKDFGQMLGHKIDDIIWILVVNCTMAVRFMIDICF